MLEHMMETFLIRLNAEYTKRGINAVAHRQQIGHSGWYVYVEGDGWTETYLVGYNNGQWEFIREFRV